MGLGETWKGKFGKLAKKFEWGRKYEGEPALEELSKLRLKTEVSQGAALQVPQVEFCFGWEGSPASKENWEMLPSDINRMLDQTVPEASVSMNLSKHMRQGGGGGYTFFFKDILGWVFLSFINQSTLSGIENTCLLEVWGRTEMVLTRYTVGNK